MVVGLIATPRPQPPAVMSRRGHLEGLLPVARSTCSRRRPKSPFRGAIYRHLKQPYVALEPLWAEEGRRAPCPALAPIWVARGRRRTMHHDQARKQPRTHATKFCFTYLHYQIPRPQTHIFKSSASPTQRPKLPYAYPAELPLMPFPPACNPLAVQRKASAAGCVAHHTAQLASPPPRMSLLRPQRRRKLLQQAARQ